MRTPTTEGRGVFIGEPALSGDPTNWSGQIHLFFRREQTRSAVVGIPAMHRPPWEYLRWPTTYLQNPAIRIEA